MPSPSDQGGRPVTPCPKCRTGDVKAVALASNLLYLRCHACAFLSTSFDDRGQCCPAGASAPDVTLISGGVSDRLLQRH